MMSTQLFIKRILTIFALVLFSSLLLLSVFYSKNQVQAQANRVILKDNDLFRVSETLGEKRLTNFNNIKMLLDERGPLFLFGRGWGNEIEGEGLSIGGSELWLLDTIKNQETKIFPGSEVNYAFFGKGETIYFTTRNQDLFVSNFKGATKKLQEKVLGPSISSDGRLLIYQKLPEKWQLGEYYDSALGLTVLDLATLQEKRATDKWEDWGALFTPDGKKIIFLSANQGGLVAFFGMNLDGSGKTQLTNLKETIASVTTVPGPSEAPIFSSDGRFLSFESDRNIWMLEFNPNFSKVVKASKVAYGVSPRFSEDGKSLSVVTSPDRNSKTPLLNIKLTGTSVK